MLQTGANCSSGGEMGSVGLDATVSPATHAAGAPGVFASFETFAGASAFSAGALAGFTNMGNGVLRYDGVDPANFPISGHASMTYATGTGNMGIGLLVNGALVAATVSVARVNTATHPVAMSFARTVALPAGALVQLAGGGPDGVNHLYNAHLCIG